MSTTYHAKYFACDLTRIGGAGVERLSRALFDACVDLNPHQIEAALFAFRSPISKGVLLADEVGLGKNIEPILCQLWPAAPAHLRRRGRDHGQARRPDRETGEENAAADERRTPVHDPLERCVERKTHVPES